LEIYNASQVTVDLSDFEIMIYPNGSIYSNSSYTLNKYLEPGGVFVIADYSSDNKIIKKADAFTSSTVIKFNGNDALKLVRISTGKIFDSIGCIGEKPEFCWGEGDTTTKDHTLRRKKTVQKGDNIPDDNFDPSEEWIGYSIDTFDGLGNLNY
jgi:predicted extracellular nuclease